MTTNFETYRLPLYQCAGVKQFYYCSWIIPISTKLSPKIYIYCDLCKSRLFNSSVPQIFIWPTVTTIKCVQGLQCQCPRIEVTLHDIYHNLIMMRSLPFNYAFMWFVLQFNPYKYADPCLSQIWKGHCFQPSGYLHLNIMHQSLPIAKWSSTLLYYIISLFSSSDLLP